MTANFGRNNGVLGNEKNIRDAICGMNDRQIRLLATLLSQGKPLEMAVSDAVYKPSDETF